jgi:aminoglycoside 3-N-acetyltransferase
MQCTNSDDLAVLWRRLGVADGDIILCHSFIGSLGRLQPNSEIIIDTLLTAAGPTGTLVTPTFTYSYFEKQDYDVENSPSTVGLLGDLARARPDAVRSLDPNFSNAAIGREAEFLMARETSHSFGPGTFYDKLCKGEGKILLIGVDFTALPLFMHIEKVEGVPYRFDLEVEGTTITPAGRSHDKAIHFARCDMEGLGNDRLPVGNLLDDDPACVQVEYGYGVHRYVPARTVVNVATDLLRRDPNGLIKLLTNEGNQ